MAIPKKGKENQLLESWKGRSCALQDHRLKEAGAFVFYIEAVWYCRKCKESLKLKCWFNITTYVLLYYV